MSRREDELEEYQKAREELEKEILEFLEEDSKKKFILEEIAKAIKMPAYWKSFEKLKLQKKRLFQVN